MIIQGFNKAHENFSHGGTCLEFGVHVGASYMRQVTEILNSRHDTKLIGFDSWQGLPAETSGVWFPERHAKGQFASGKDVILNKLGAYVGDYRFRLIDGFFENSLTSELQASINDLIFVNVDVDIHSSCVEILEFIRPMLRPGVIIYFDDWKDPQDKFEGEWGEHLAWKQFTEKYPDIKWSIFTVNIHNQRCLEIE